MEAKEIITLALGLIGGGGIAALITAIASSKKTGTDIVDVNVNNAIELQEIAMRNYKDNTERLKMAEELLIKVRQDLELAERYIYYLERFIESKGLSITKETKTKFHRGC